MPLYGTSRNLSQKLLTLLEERILIDRQIPSSLCPWGSWVFRMFRNSNWSETSWWPTFLLQIFVSNQSKVVACWLFDRIKIHFDKKRCAYINPPSLLLASMWKEEVIDTNHILSNTNPNFVEGDRYGKTMQSSYGQERTSRKTSVLPDLFETVKGIHINWFTHSRNRRRVCLVNLAYTVGQPRRLPAKTR